MKRIVWPDWTTGFVPECLPMWNSSEHMFTDDLPGYCRHKKIEAIKFKTLFLTAFNVVEV